MHWTKEYESAYKACKNGISEDSCLTQDQGREGGREGGNNFIFD